MKTVRFFFLAMSLLLLFLPPAFGQTSYPEKPLTIIVPLNPGGTADIHMRIVAHYLAQELGQPVSIVNKPGGGMVIGLREIIHSKPDGYTLGCVVIAGTEVLRKDAGVNIDELRMIGSFSATVGTVIVAKEGPLKTLSEFVDYAKKNPGKLAISCSADIWKLHVMELEEAFGIDLNPIMFTSGAQAFTALLGGHVNAMMGGFQFPVKQADKGVKALVVTGGTKRLDVLPDVPTCKELGYDIDYQLMFILVAPEKVPEPVLDKLRKAYMNLGKNPEFAEKISTGLGDLWAPMYGDELEAYCKKINAKVASKLEKFKKEFEQ